MDALKKYGGFLKDVFLVSLGAYGGPEAHYGVFAKRFVDQKKYLSEDALYEYMALSSVCPGPSSTQTLMAIGYHVGGIKLACLSLLVWALPIGVMLSLMAFLYTRALYLETIIESLGGLTYIALGFVFYAASRMMRKGWKNPVLLGLGTLSFVFTLWLRAAWVFPLVLISSGLFYSLLNRPSIVQKMKPLSPHLNKRLLSVFGILVGLSFWAVTAGPSTVKLAGHFFQFGFLVIGGGQVVIPYMVETLVHDLALLSLSDFLVGFGLVQGLPGPMFSFSAWAGSLSAAALGIPLGLASLISMVSLFLPGALLILIMLPVWNAFKEASWVKPALGGIIAAAAGVVLSTGVDLILASPSGWMGYGFTALTFGLLSVKKIPAPFIVFGGIILSILVF